MIATGTDVRPLECVFFMRDVRSATYFEQMKGRGARTIPDADFQAVTPDAERKTRFVIVDAVGVTEHDYVDVTPLDREKGVTLDKLLEKAALLTLTEDETATLASRLARLEADLTPAERTELDTVAGAAGQGHRPRPGRRRRPGPAAAGHRRRADRRPAGRPAAGDPGPARRRRPTPGRPTRELRARILELRRSHDQIIDEISVDVLLDAHGVVDPDRARYIVESWRDYLDENRDEITALQLLYSQPG